MQKPKYLALFAVFAFAATLAACGGGSSGGGSVTPPSGGGSTPTPPAGVGTNAVGVALPTTGIGVEIDPMWGSIGGYTQNVYSQVLAFPVGTTITVKNRDNTVHTMNVVATSSGPPANFPANPSLSTGASGGTSLAVGYSSGNIASGASMSVTLATAGTYLIGCAYHYVTNNMRDIIQVSNSATPGPQATPQPSSGGGGGGCTGPYC